MISDYYKWLLQLLDGSQVITSDYNKQLLLQAIIWLICAS